MKNGTNIVPEQIDEVICEHPAVLEAACVGIADEQCGHEVLLCCTLKPGSSCSEQELRDYCSDRLGEFKSPKIIKVVQKLPKDSVGKVERASLPDLLP